MALKSTKDLELRISAKNETGATFSKIATDIKKFANDVSSAGAGQGGGIMGGLKGALSSVSSAFQSIGSIGVSVFSSITDAVQSAGSYLRIFGETLLVIGKDIVKSFIEVNSEFEKIKVTIDVLTHGQGEVWFNKLNNWAIDMPISMTEVTRAFTTMNAYGLSPSIKLMQNLLDVSSVLPDSGRAIVGIARAMGQIQSKTRLEGQELRQLAEWAVPGYEAVYNKLFVNLAKRTGKSVGKMKFTMIDADSAIKAFSEVMTEHFGGAAERISHTWGGMMTVLTNYYKEFVREIGESGLFASFEKKVEDFVKFLGDSFKSGEMQKLTKLISESLGVAFKGVFDFKLATPKKDLGAFADYFVYILSVMIKAVDLLYRGFLGIKLVLLVIKMYFSTMLVSLTAELYGIMWILDKIIQGAIWVALRVPGLSKESIDSLNEQSKTSTDLVQKSYENLAGAAQGWMNNVKDIEDTTIAIANSATVADNKITDLKDKLKAYHEEATKPIIPVEPKAPPFKYDERSLPMGPFPEATYDEKATVNNLTNFIKHASIGQLIAYQLRTGSEEGLKSILSKVKGFKGAIVKEFFAIVDSIKSSLSNVFEEIIKGNMNLIESFTAMGKIIREAMIKASADIAAEWVKDQFRILYNHLFVEKAKTVATVEGNAERGAVEEATTLKSIALKLWEGLKFITVEAYKAAAAMWTFFAGLGPFGWIAGGVAAGAAIATVLAFGKKLGSFETGTGLMGVRDTGPALLHKGEIVLNKKESDVFRDMASNGNQTSNINLSFSISAMDGADIEKIVRKKVIPLIRENIRDYGKGYTMVREVK